MKGNIRISDLEKLRKMGYRFLKNKESDRLKVFYDKELLYSIRVKQNGHLIIRGKRKESILETKKEEFICEGIHFFLNPIDDTIAFFAET